jgi:hypothetical protein
MRNVLGAAALAAAAGLAGPLGAQEPPPSPEATPPAEAAGPGSEAPAEPAPPAGAAVEADAQGPADAPVPADTPPADADAPPQADAPPRADAPAQADAPAPAGAPAPVAGGPQVGEVPPAPTGERPADQLTCRDLQSYEAASVPGLLYFVAGHRAGMEEAVATGDLEAAQRRLEGAADAPGPDAAIDAPAPEQPDAGAGEAVAGEAGAGGAVAPEAGAAEPDGLQAAAEPVLVTVPGHFQIPIERAVLLCAEEPDARVGDIVVRAHAEEVGAAEAADGAGDAAAPGPGGG